MEINIRSAAGKSLKLEGCSKWGDIKKKVANAWPNDFPVERQRFMYLGKPVNCSDAEELSQDMKGCTLHLLKKLGVKVTTETGMQQEQEFRSVGPSLNQSNSTPGGMQQIQVIVPQGATAGMQLRVSFNSRTYEVVIPVGCNPGSRFIANIPSW